VTAWKGRPAVGVGDLAKVFQPVCRIGFHRGQHPIPLARKGQLVIRLMAGIAGGLILSSALGCAMCASPHDEAYAAYGGKRPRQDMYQGRVGSAFRPAGEVWETSSVAVDDGSTPSQDGPEATE
jgi:hypothetical protein